MSTEAAAAMSRNGIMGHPRGLLTLSTTEMWERFSYYGMRALLVLFMVEAVDEGGLGYSDQTATAIYGLYTAAVYVIALPGGWIADRLIGGQRAVWYGGIIIMCGHFILAIPTVWAFFTGLAFVAVGTGLLKPNISAIVGEFYPPGDPRRDGGFTIFYMGINVGAALGPLVCGFLAQENWHYGFAVAGFGMLFGLIQFRVTQDHLGDAGRLPPARRENDAAFERKAWGFISASLLAVAFVMAAALNGVLTIDAVALAQASTYIIAGLGALYFVYLFTFGNLTTDERDRVIVLIVLFIACAIFWSGFEQAGSSLNLFADRYTIREFGDFTIPPTWFQSLNPVFIIVLAPFYSMIWISLARRNLDPSSPLKFAIGLIILGLGFAIMIGAATLVAEGQQVLPTWLFFTYLLHTMGELALSPVGLSAVTKLSPRRYVGQLMGVWWLATSLGNILAGLLAGEFRADAVEEMPGLYTQIVITTVGAGILLALVSKPLKRLTRGVE
ncbi:MAG: peptide MFS transporter [Gammaproteobacteria bacterium]